MSKRELEPDIEYQKAFGDNLRLIRESIGWTQGDLYSHSKVSVHQIGIIENGHEGPSFQTLLALARALGKPPSHLFDFKYHHQLNKSFQRTPRKKPGTANLIRTLLEDDFFSKPRSVQDVTNSLIKKYNKQVKSADVSGLLLIYVQKKKLKKSRLSNKNLYQSLK